MIRLLLSLIVLFSLIANRFEPALAGEHVPDSCVGLMVNMAADGMVDKEIMGFDVETCTPAQLRDEYRKWVDQFARTRVTELLLNVNYHRAAFPSKAWDCYGDEGKDNWPSAWCGKNAAILAKGVDHYAICFERCRELGISPWASVRMNDHHWLDNPKKSSRFWQAHPEYRLGSGRSRYDFGHEEVRTYHLALIREVLERYDIDGIELDWLRTLPTIKGPDPQENKRKLTDFMRQVREAADRVAKRRGRPISVAVRVPTRPTVADAYDLDVTTWVRDGFVDTVIACNCFTSTDTDIPLEQWRDLIGKTERPYVLVAGTDHGIRAYPKGRKMSSTLESLRGFTAAMVGRGANSIYLFNHFNPNCFKYADANVDPDKITADDYRRVFEETGSLTAALVHPRLHVLTFHDQGASSKSLPAPLTAESPVDLKLDIGPKPSQGKAILHIGLEGNGKIAPKAQLNGDACKNIADLQVDKSRCAAALTRYGYGYCLAQTAPRVAQYEIPLSHLRSGKNNIRLSLKEELSRGIDLRVVWCSIRLAP